MQNNKSNTQVEIVGELSGLTVLPYVRYYTPQLTHRATHLSQSRKRCNSSLLHKVDRISLDRPTGQRQRPNASD